MKYQIHELILTELGITLKSKMFNSSSICNWVETDGIFDLIKFF